MCISDVGRSISLRLCPPQDQFAWNRTQHRLGAQMGLHDWKMSAWTSISQPVHDTSSDRGTKRRGDCHISPHSSREVLEPSAWDAPRQRKPIFTLKGRLIRQPLSSLSPHSVFFCRLSSCVRRLATPSREEGRLHKSVTQEIPTLYFLSDKEPVMGDEFVAAGGFDRLWGNNKAISVCQRSQRERRGEKHTHTRARTHTRTEGRY